MKLRRLALAALLCLGSTGAMARCNIVGGFNIQQWYSICGPALQQDYAMGAGRGMPFQQFVMAMYQIYLQPPRMQGMPAMPAPAMGNAGMMCAIGSSQCFNGWLRTCQQMATGGSWWVTSAQRCN